MAWAMLAMVLVAVGIIIALQFVRDDGGTAAAVEEAGPAHIETIEGSEISRVTLTSSAAERLAIKTTLIRKVGRAFAIPYSALLYDESGNTWVYTNPKPLVFERKAIKVVRIERSRVLLSSGPRAGTRIASVGVPELYGTEFEVGH
jgi:hypothetical protein